MDLDTPCKIWTGALEKTGYGRRKVKGKMWMAHRFAYQEHYGDLDPDLVVDHLCFNRACVEPTHLRQITREENAVRHNPGCGCVACQPELNTMTVCRSGHDLSKPGSRHARTVGGRIGRCAACERSRWLKSSTRARRMSRAA